MAMTAESLRGPMRFMIDLTSGLIQQPIRQQLMKGDKKANAIVVVLTEDKKPADLSGVTVTGSFISPMEGAEIPLSGSVNGNEASVTLVDECYAEEGHFEANIKLTAGETSRTILSITGHVLSKGSGEVIDIGDVIPNIDDIIAQYAAMKKAVEETNDARDAANEAAKHAPYVDADTNHWMTWDTETGAYVDTGVKATGPEGPQGPPGQNGIGSGTVTGIQIGGETYEPDATGVVELPELGGGVPDGGTTGQMLFKTSDENGAAEWQTPTHDKVGALGSDPQEDESTESPEMGSVPINADQLGGMTFQQVLDNAEKQAKENADTMIVEGSRNLVTSGAVYSALERFGKLLWEGSFSSGSITVPGLRGYEIIAVIGNGIVCFGAKWGGLGGYTMYASTNNNFATYRFQYVDDVLSITDTDKGFFDNGVSAPVQRIYGLF